MSMIEMTEDEIELASETLVGDVRDFLLDRVKGIQKPWEKMSEYDQRDQIYAAESAARTLVRKSVKMIAAEGRKVITGNLEQVTVKDGIKAVITLSKADECRHELIDSCGQAVLVVVADTESFSGEREEAIPDPDQPELIDETAQEAA